MMVWAMQLLSVTTILKPLPQHKEVDNTLLMCYSI
jgi:hypothetical protein